MLGFLLCVIRSRAEIVAICSLFLCAFLRQCPRFYADMPSIFSRYVVKNGNFYTTNLPKEARYIVNLASKYHVKRTNARFLCTRRSSCKMSARYLPVSFIIACNNEKTPANPVNFHLPIYARREHDRRPNVYLKMCSYGKIRHFTGFYGISERSPVALHAEIVVICSIFY